MKFTKVVDEFAPLGRSKSKQIVIRTAVGDLIDLGINFSKSLHQPIPPCP